ncbi:hypothetical protein ACLOJK_002823 [Asimina triloba]
MSDDPRDFLWRGCVSRFDPPGEGERMREEDEHEATALVQFINEYNPNVEIVFRSGSRDYDILHRVFRWNTTHYRDVFRQGFRARTQDNTPNHIYFNLVDHVNNGGPPGDPNYPRENHVFVSTSLASGSFFRPNRRIEGIIYRYEIYAPGGILVAQTYSNSNIRYPYSGQHEVAFVSGIAREYISSAQAYRAVYDHPGDSRGCLVRADTDIIENRHFNPIPGRRLEIQTPVRYYIQIVQNGDRRERRRVNLHVRHFPPLERRKREAAVDLLSESEAMEWYGEDVTNINTYITAAFRSCRTNQAYLFMGNEYVVVVGEHYGGNETVANGPPLLISDGFPSLAGTAFAEYGVDCAFASHDENEAFLFCGNLCAQLNYADGQAIKGPKTIAAMFPMLKGTVFEDGVDAAFESTTRYQAYLFKDENYAMIRYGPDERDATTNYGPDYYDLAVTVIDRSYQDLGGSVFASGIDAALASHKTNEAYLFKGDSYVCIKFFPDDINGHVIDGVKPILHGWPSLKGILPRKNESSDGYDDNTTAATPTESQIPPPPTATPTESQIPPPPTHDEL